MAIFGGLALQAPPHAVAKGLVVIGEEEDHKALLVHRISTEDIYHRQGGELAALP
jgi:hypothetical protein